MGMVIYFRSASQSEINHLTKNPDTLNEFMFGEFNSEPKSIDFDKAWDALQFMLLGNKRDLDSPLNIMYVGDDDLYGTDENGFGGYWVIDPEAVRVFHSNLAKISDATLAEAFDTEAMVAENIYLSDTFVVEGLESLSYIMQSVPDLRELARSAAGSGSYLVGMLN
jgi:Domain of unknown function (DUF1877)